MILDSHRYNLAHLELIAHSLGDLLSEVTFVGGCTTLLFVDKAAIGGVRQTEDVDIIVDVASLLEYQKFSKRLRALGFYEDISGPICRWKIRSGEAEIKLDVMPDSEEILGFSNRWYKDAMQYANAVTLPSGTQINVVAPGYFLATKFEAFLGRGKGNYFSHDLEDIVFVLENRTDFMKELFSYPDGLKTYLAQQAQALINEEFLNVLPGLVLSPDGERAVLGYLKLMGSRFK